MLSQLDDYDWKQAFGFAGEPDTEASPNLTGVPGEGLTDDLLRPITREDVVEIAAMKAGENDGDSWMIYGRVMDGRWFFLDAWCDYTGWDCRAGGTCSFAWNKEECEALCLTEQARGRLGVVLH